MASSGTLLSDLGGGGSNGPSGDEDLVKRIFADMNGGGGGNQMIMSPNPNTTAPMAMDSGPQTSHVIGKDHPTPGDFAAAMHQASRVQQAYQMPPPQGTGSMGPSQGQWGAPYQQQQQPQQFAEPPKKNIYATIAEETKIPIFVALLVFVFSLPFLNILFQHYIPSLVKPTGDLTTIGLLGKSVIAGATFWVLQRIVVPLISL
jgi:hypothetical protein